MICATKPFQGKSKGGTIVDWEAGVDRIDLSRLDEVDDFEDITITQTSETAATITFVNDKCQEATVDVFSSAPFELTSSDFLL